MSRLGKFGEQVVYLKDIEAFCDRISKIIAVRDEVLELTLDEKRFREIKLETNGMLYVLLEARDFFSLGEAEDAELERRIREDMKSID